MTDEVPICRYCWIRVIKEPDTGKVVVGEERAPKWMHSSHRSDTGNPSCGRRFLEDEEIEYVSDVAEA